VLERGRYTTIEAPDPNVWLFPFDINNRGQLTGEYVRIGPDGIPDSESGFLRDARGRVTVLDVPGARGTEAVKLNDRGQVLGVYTDAAGAFHGFVLTRGRLVSFDAPDQGDFLLPFDINTRGQIVGYTVDDPVTMAGARGFLLAKGARGPAAPISFPGAPRTIAAGINDQGQIVGFYENPNVPPSRQPTGGQPRPGMGPALTTVRS
jgi:hypothetical protein